MTAGSYSFPTSQYPFFFRSSREWICLPNSASENLLPLLVISDVLEDTIPLNEKQLLVPQFEI